MTRYAMKLTADPNQSSVGLIEALRNLLDIGTKTAKRYLSGTTMIDLPKGMTVGQRRVLLAGIQAAQPTAKVEIHGLQHSPDRTGHWKIYRIDDERPYHDLSVKVYHDASTGRLLYQQTYNDGSPYNGGFEMMSENPYDDPSRYACIREGDIDYLANP